MDLSTDMIQFCIPGDIKAFQPVIKHNYPFHRNFLPTT